MFRKNEKFFVLRNRRANVGGKESSLFPMSNEDMADWTERFLRDVKGIWPGPQS